MSLSILSARTRRTCRADQAAACEWCHLSILMRPRRAFTFGISSVDVLYCSRDFRPRRTRDPAPTGGVNHPACHLQKSLNLPGDSSVYRSGRL